jgi:chaperonin GroES
MNLKPLGDRLVVRREKASDRSVGGIYLPDTAKGKPQKGEVLAAGPGKLLKNGTRKAMQVKKGDKILFTNWAGDEFKEHSGDNLLVMHEEDVLAVLEE